MTLIRLILQQSIPARVLKASSASSKRLSLLRHLAEHSRRESAKPVRVSWPAVRLWACHARPEQAESKAPCQSLFWYWSSARAFHPAALWAPDCMPRRRPCKLCFQHIQAHHTPSPFYSQTKTLTSNSWLRRGWKSEFEALSSNILIVIGNCFRDVDLIVLVLATTPSTHPLWLPQSIWDGWAQVLS